MCGDMVIKKKKGVLTLLESVISVLIILIGLVFFVSQQAKTIGKEEKAKELARLILNEIEKNQTLRDYVRDADIGNLNSSIKSLLLQLSPIYDFTFCISEIALTCIIHGLPEKKDIFADSLLISYINQTTGKLETKKIVLYIWAK